MSYNFQDQPGESQSEWLGHEDKMTNPEEQSESEKEAYKYVNKHNFDGEIRNLCWASYHDGHVDGKSKLQAVADEVEGDNTNYEIAKRIDETDGFSPHQYAGIAQSVFREILNKHLSND